MVMPAVTLLTMRHPHYARVALATPFCAMLGWLVAWWLRFGSRRPAKTAALEVDAKIAEARRIRAIERRLRETPAPGAETRQVRVSVEDDEAEAEAEVEARGAEVQRRRVRR